MISSGFLWIFRDITTDSLKLAELETKMKEAISVVMDASCFLPYIQRHEVESLMFTNMDGFNIVVDDEESLRELQHIMDSYPTPEDINGGAETAPSKRLMHIFPYEKTTDGEMILEALSIDDIRTRCPRPYEKTTDGEMILEALSIDDIRTRCPRFNEWMTKLEEGIRNDYF